ncbi:hypothetical protein E2C01_016882 [Portunus trituberculatus]|uniref:Uncharacterized protein n=1 Tax=Portunus trituberculatus TaxID=210409 RepID=A0A5B7DRP4_PORTR|nr:hypothetical protein [Portunus trituberculatus]
MKMCINTCDVTHEELGAYRMARDVADVEVRNACLNHYQNPFKLEKVPGDLFNIVTASKFCQPLWYSGTMRAVGSEGSPSARVRILSTSSTSLINHQGDEKGSDFTIVGDTVPVKLFALLRKGWPLRLHGKQSNGC